MFNECPFLPTQPLRAVGIGESCKNEILALTVAIAIAKFISAKPTILLVLLQ